LIFAQAPVLAVSAGKGVRGSFAIGFGQRGGGGGARKKKKKKNKFLTPEKNAPENPN
jgi:hypothetical protein